MTGTWRIHGEVRLPDWRTPRPPGALLARGETARGRCRRQGRGPSLLTHVPPSAASIDHPPPPNSGGAGSPALFATPESGETVGAIWKDIVNPYRQKEEVADRAEIAATTDHLSLVEGDPVTGRLDS